MGDTIVLIIELIGIIAFSIAGSTIAIKKEFDIFGVSFIGIITALGGGILRDIILGIFPPIMFTNKIYTIFALITSLIVFFIAYRNTNKFFSNLDTLNSITNVFDSIGLGIFAVTSVQRCMAYGYGDNAFLCIFMAMTACIGGGIIRDLLCHELPVVLRKKIYALAAIFGAAIYYYMIYFNINKDISLISGVAVIVIIRLLATKYEWHMPRIKMK